METDSSLQSTSMTERLVMRELADLREQGRTPVQAPALVSQTRDRLDAYDEIIGCRVTEADVVRCCRSLEDRDLVRSSKPELNSPAGMGRPAYELTVNPETVREFVRENGLFRRRPPDVVTP